MALSLRQPWRSILGHVKSDGSGPQTDEAYSTRELTNDLKAFPLTNVELVLILRRRKPTVLFAFQQMVLI